MESLDDYWGADVPTEQIKAPVETPAPPKTPAARESAAPVSGTKGLPTDVVAKGAAAEADEVVAVAAKEAVLVEADGEGAEEAVAVGDDDSDDGEFGAGLLEDPPADSDAHFSDSASEGADGADEDDAPAEPPMPTLTAEGAQPPARMSVDEAEANKQAKQQRAERKRRRHADASCIHPSLADLEARETEKGGSRQSQRRKMKVLEFWRNERVVYGRRQSVSPPPFSFNSNYIIDRTAVYGRRQSVSPHARALLLPTPHLHYPLLSHWPYPCLPSLPLHFFIKEILFSIRIIIP
ncbi:hypothetical protein T492DRAFT_527843 [Pavlovales sp. CCMP2436]|nr:hypothetical protein T492DRAFT_527843 [Pavlovales sp. CCMP2436]